MPAKRIVQCAFAVCALLALLVLSHSVGGAAQTGGATVSRLTTIWTSGDPEVAHRMVLMYSHAAKQNKWIDEVRLVVWGPSARLLAADKDLQAKIADVKKDGVDVKACVVCADSYSVTKTLRDLGIEFLQMGNPLTEMLQSDWKVVTFQDS